jgi:hypothetical protein
MSNRSKAFEGTQKNPSTKFLDWKSNDKQFSFYDREKEANVLVPLPFKFVVLDELHTVKGWDDASQSAIYSNEVKYISKQEMTVKPFKGNEIAKGLYSLIKEKVRAAGGHYVKSIYIMLESGQLANIQLKGSSTQAWGEFTKANKSKLTENWIEVNNATEAKKGSVKYSTPNFTIGSVLNDKESKQADENFDILEAYLKQYLSIEVVEEEEIKEDLVF